MSQKQDEASSPNDFISFSVPGTPIPKARPRFVRAKLAVRVYDSQSSEQKTLEWQLKARTRGMQPLNGPLSLSMVCMFARPKSRLKKKEVFHTVVPDLDNLVKFFCDVANGILWHDDKQVASITATKVYGAEAKTIVTVRELHDRNN